MFYTYKNYKNKYVHIKLCAYFVNKSFLSIGG